MSHRTPEKQRRPEARLAAEARARRRRGRSLWIVGLAVVSGLVSAAFLLPARNTAAPLAADHGAERGAVALGTRAPDFRVTNAVTGAPLSLGDLRGSRTLLFFSEGASCQACLVQASDLQKSKTLRRAGIDLVSITTDSPDVLAEVAADYGITTPLLADESRAMSLAYGQLGRGGMGHPDTDGHSFVLLDAGGRVTWERAYQEMYVPTKQLLADMRA